jgi:hypothetical protein
MGSILVRVVISAVLLVAVGEVSQRLPRVGALLLSLPIVSLLAFVMAWTRNHDLAAMSRLARETLVLVPLGLPFFVPLALADRLGLGFWWAFSAGIAAATLIIGTYLFFAPQG